MTNEQRMAIMNHASDVLALFRVVLPGTAEGVQGVFDSGLQSSTVNERLSEDDAHELRDVIRAEPRAVLNAIQQALEEPGPASTPASRAVGDMIDSLPPPPQYVRSTRLVTTVSLRLAARIRQAAEDEGVSVAEWIRAACCRRLDD